MVVAGSSLNRIQASEAFKASFSLAAARTKPAIVQVPDTTIVVHPDQAARLDPYGNVLIDLHGEA